MVVRRVLWVIVAGWIALAPVVRAQEPPEDPEARERRGWVRELVHRAARGDWLEPEAEERLQGYLRAHLLRPRLDAIQASYYEIAEIHLKQGRAARAVEALKRFLQRAAKPDTDVAWLTHYNLALIYRHHTADTASVIAELEQVKGPLEVRARRDLLEVLRQAGRVGEAADLIKEWINAAKQKGQRLALMQRLAALYRRAGELDEALAIHQKITTEFTPADLRAIRAEAAASVKQRIDEAMRLQAAGEWDRVERTLQALHRWVGRLRGQGRLDEFRAAERALREGMRRFEAAERERHERRGRDEPRGPERPHDPPRPPERPVR